MGLKEKAQFCSRAEKKSISKKKNVLKTFLEIETTHHLEGLDLKLNNETYAKVHNL